jgi:hypothetical protein
MKRLLLGLFLFSGAALACEKIEYVEAKDWTADELHLQACAALKEAGENPGFLASYDPMSGKIRESVAIECHKQYDLYVRILKNVHHKEQWSCEDVWRRIK